MNYMVPQISVCIPTYNRAGLLAKVIECALNQEAVDNYEIVVVDNASTDNTAEVVASFKDKKIRYVRNEVNLGMVGNWNRCLEVARGEYITLWHDDDLYYSDLLFNQIQQFEFNSNLGLVYCACNFINEQGSLIGQSYPFSKAHSWIGIKELEYLLIKNYLYGPPLVRRECYQKVGTFKTSLRYLPDWDMWIRIATHYDTAYIPQILSSYRFHTTQLTHILHNEGLTLTEDCIVLDNAFDIFKNPPLTLYKSRQAGYYEATQRRFWEAFFGLRNHTFLDAWRSFKCGFHMLVTRSGWGFFSYSIKDAIQLYKKRKLKKFYTFE